MRIIKTVLILILHTLLLTEANAQELPIDSFYLRLKSMTYLENAANVNCDDQASMIENRICLNLACQKAIVRLEEKLNSLIKNYQDKSQASKIDTLIYSQQKWMNERDKKCGHIYDLYKGGSLAPVAYMECAFEEIKNRLAVIEELIRTKP